MTDYPGHYRIALSDDELDRYGFPDECPDCGAESVYPMGATKSGGNLRRCLACDNQYEEH